MHGQRHCGAWQSNRVCQVLFFRLAGWQLEEVLAPMQLTHLRLSSYGETMPVIPDSFLDGSAPRLRHFRLSGIPFPGLPKLILSANHLVDLERLSSSIFLIPGTFHPKRWSLSSPRRPASKNFALDSDPPNLALTGKAQVCHHQTAPSSPLSENFISKALPNIQRTS
jgi:hypothetical protein